MPKLIAPAWESYGREVLPPNAPTVQRWECRRAFYAGAQAMFNLVEKIGGGAESEDAGARELQKLQDELRRFVADVMAGRA